LQRRRLVGDLDEALQQEFGQQCLRLDMALAGGLLQPMGRADTADRHDLAFEIAAADLVGRFGAAGARRLGIDIERRPFPPVLAKTRRQPQAGG
jgi:hypothetical protein